MTKNVCTCNAHEGNTLCQVHGAKERKGFYKYETQEDNEEEE